MRLLISLMLVTTIAGAQEVRAPQRGEERREQRVERPEPVRVQPPVQEQRRDASPRQVEPRPEPQRPIDRPPMVRPVNPPIFIGGPCWNRWDCRVVNPRIQMRFDFDRNRCISKSREDPLRLDLFFCWPESICLRTRNPLRSLARPALLLAADLAAYPNQASLLFLRLVDLPCKKPQC